MSLSLLRASRHSTTVLRTTTASLVSQFSRNVSSEAASVETEEQHGDVTVQPGGDVVNAYKISGAPDELWHRAVRIFQPTRNTMQSGSGKSERWRIDWDILEGGGRWENPLMGFASSADYMQGTRLTFRTKEDAIHFAEKQGWNYFVQQPTVKRIPPKNYAENYVYKPRTLRIMRTK